MMLCPTCRREVEQDAAACPRCGTSLLELAAIEAAAARLHRRGVALLRGRQPLAALRILRAAEQLHHTPENRRAIVATLLCVGRFPAAVSAADKR